MTDIVKRYAIVVGGVVSNIAVATSPLAQNWIESETASIGDLYVNGEFIKPTPSEENP